MSSSSSTTTSTTKKRNRISEENNNDRRSTVGNNNNARRAGYDDDDNDNDNHEIVGRGGGSKQQRETVDEQLIDNNDDLSEEGLVYDENFKDPEPEEFDLDFEFFDAQEADYHGIKSFLNGFVDPAEFLDTSDIADAICNVDKSIGNLIKVDEELFGLNAVIPFHYLQGTEVLKSLVEILNKHVPNNLKAQLDDALRRRVCLIVNERSLNCPPMVAAPLHGALHSERAAIDDDESFDADYFLLIASGYRKASAKKKKSKHTDNSDSIEFYNFETAAYLNNASVQFSFPIKPLGQDVRWTWRGNVKPITVVMLVPKEAIPNVLIEIDAKLAEIV